MGTSRWIVIISDLGQHASKDFQAKVIFVTEAVRPPFGDPDLDVDILHCVFRRKLTTDSAPN